MSRRRDRSPADRPPERPVTAAARGLTRRELLAGAAGAAGALVARHGVASAEAASSPPAQAPADPTKVPGAPTSALGDRSPFERPERLGNGAAVGSSRTPLQDLHGIVTPSDLHFERHHAGIPAIDPASYALLIHGMVERPMLFTLDDLKRFPARSQLLFVECSGNGGAAYRAEPSAERTPQDVDGLLSTSEWTGVPLASLLREAGASRDATWFLAEGSDAAVMTRSIPMEKAWDDALIAYGQNGEAIRPAQGYPARLLLPGWEGNASVKWIRRIELSDRPFMTREETARYSDPLADGTARLFSFTMDAKSIITHPAFPARLSRGWHEISGVAWTGRGRIARVEVSVDGGVTWTDAALQEPVLPLCQTRFRHRWNWRGERAVLMSRAVDETGYVQPTYEALRAARGPATHYHYNNIRAWTVRPNGTVVFGTA